MEILRVLDRLACAAGWALVKQIFRFCDFLNIPAPFDARRRAHVEPIIVKLANMSAAAFWACILATSFLYFGFQSKLLGLWPISLLLLIPGTVFAITGVVLFYTCKSEIKRLKANLKPGPHS